MWKIQFCVMVEKRGIYFDVGGNIQTENGPLEEILDVYILLYRRKVMLVQFVGGMDL